MKKSHSINEKEKQFLKKHLKELFHIYVESEAADCQIDRQNKLYVFLELTTMLKEFTSK